MLGFEEDVLYMNPTSHHFPLELSIERVLTRNYISVENKTVLLITVKAPKSPQRRTS